MSRTWRRNLSVDQVSELDIPRRGGAPLPPPPPKSPLRKHRSAGDPLSHHHHHASPAFSPDVIQEGKEYASPLYEPPSGEKNWERRFHSFRKDQSNTAGGRFRFSTEFSPRKNSGGRQRRLHMRTLTPTQPTSDVRSVKHTPAPSVPILTNNNNSRKPHGRNKKDRDGDEAVRGGNIFTNMFKSSASSLEKKPKQEQLHRRIRSMDTLDETRRNGSEVAHSPRLVKSAHHASLDNTPNQKPLHRRIRSMNTLDETRRNGSSRRLVNRHSSTSLEDQSGPLQASTDGQRRRQETLGDVGVVQTPRAPASHVPVGQENSQHLSTLFSTSKMQTTGMKKAFTKFHNSSSFSEDATSAYLGDDLSSNKEHFTMINNVVLGLNKESAGTRRLSEKGSGPRRLDLVDLQRRLPVSLSRSVPSILEMESEDGRRPSHRVLRPIQGTEEWKPGRRYLIAPAALMHCPVQVFSLLSGGSPRLDDATTNTTHPNHIFGPLCLGTASMTYVGGTNAHQRGQWSYGLLSLFQNYLVEYDEESPGMIPRGYAHLQHAKASFHPEFPNALTLEFYDSPCAKTDKRVLLIRTKSKSETERWVTCLNRAATLNVENLYEYDKENPCGRGRYATVYRAKRRDSSCGLTNGYSCAVKIIDKSKFWGRVANGVERADTLVRETAVQATLSAQHGQRPFLKLQSFFETSESVVIETELLEGTDLFHYISKKGVLEEDEASNFAFDLLTSLETMNRLGLAHRDVKPANILMCDKEKDGVFVKLGDFGMSTFVGVDGLVRGRCGTPGYVAPEIFEAGVHRGYGNQVDVFSAGVTLYVMLCGYEPFYGESDAELIAANRQAELDFPNEEWGATARDLVEKMLQADPKLRISAAEALQHDWIRDRRSSSVESFGSLLDKSLSRGTSEPNAKDQSACAIS